MKHRIPRFVVWHILYNIATIKISVATVGTSYTMERCYIPMRETSQQSRSGEKSEICRESHSNTCDVLNKVGITAHEAAIVAYIGLSGPSTSKEISKTTGIRQPDVSLSFKMLLQEEIIQKCGKKQSSRGRPSDLYTLSLPLKEMILHLAEREQIRIDLVLERLNEAIDYADAME